MTKAKTKAKKRPRAIEREGRRALGKLANKLDALVVESPGGSPQRALPVSSASVIDNKARGFRCGRCEGELELRDHQAEFQGSIQFRRVDLVCKSCFHPRRLWFTLGAPTGN